jgi:hypothetical protein
VILNCLINSDRNKKKIINCVWITKITLVSQPCIQQSFSRFALLFHNCLPILHGHRGRAHFAEIFPPIVCHAFGDAQGAEAIVNCVTVQGPCVHQAQHCDTRQPAAMEPCVLAKNLRPGIAFVPFLAFEVQHLLLVVVCPFVPFGRNSHHFTQSTGRHL